MLSVTKLAYLVGYFLLALGLTLANAPLAFELAPTGDLLGSAGFYLGALSAAIFILGLVALMIGWMARNAPAPRDATPR